MSKYNGWTNRATWLVSLHLQNDQGLAYTINDLAAEVKGSWQPEASLAGAIEHCVTDWVDMILEDAEISGSNDPIKVMMIDMLGTMLDQVNWAEIAANWLAE